MDSFPQKSSETSRVPTPEAAPAPQVKTRTSASPAQVAEVLAYALYNLKKAGTFPDSVREEWQKHTEERAETRDTAKSILKLLGEHGVDLRAADSKAVLKHLAYLRTIPASVAYNDDELV